MSIFVLRLLAIITMTIDHVGGVLLNNQMYLRAIGRAAFILFVFMLAEGFLHMKDDRKRCWKHILLLGILALVSEFPYDMMRLGMHTRNWFSAQNVIWTLLLGFFCLYFSWYVQKKVNMNLSLVFGFLAGLCAYLIKSDYGLAGVVLIVLFYNYCRYYNNRMVPWYQKMLMCILLYGVFILTLYGLDGRIQRMYELRNQITAIGTAIPFLLIPFYNGKVGYHAKWFRYFSKTYYPIHMLVIGLIKILK